MFPAAAAAAHGPAWPLTPVPQPFSPYECYQRCSSPAVVRTATPGLTVNLPGPEYAQVLAEFEVRTAPGNNGRLVASGQTSPVPAPRVVTWQVPDSVLTGGETYYWRSRALAEQAPRPSEWTPWQQVSIDTEAPETPTVNSEEYPEKQWGAVLGTPGTFHFSSASSDVVEFRWWLNGGSATKTPATGTGPVTASVTFTPPQDMVNVLTVQAVDPAGWTSMRRYEFWVSPPPVLFSHWTLDEQGGTTAADSGTIAAAGTLSGEVAFGPGYVGGSNGAVFTGSGGQITTTGPVLDTTQSFTVMAWVNLADPALGDQTVLSQNGTQASGFQLHFKQDANAGAGGWCFTVRTADSPDAAQTVCADGSIAGLPTVGQWVHIAGRYDAIAGQMALYVMGGENCFGESARSTFTSTWSADGSFVIGQSVDGQRWRGGVDDVYAHQLALSETKICQQAIQ